MKDIFSCSSRLWFLQARNQNACHQFRILTCPNLADSRLSFSGCRIGYYETDPDLRSDTNNRLAREWLNDCQLEHENCLDDKERELPTRVIDVGNSEGTGPVRLVHSNGQRAKYVTLSYCWGGRIDTILTKDRLESYAQSIAYADLPLTFQDAIKITRSIGIQYLWIDALCIVQDSSRDWEIESKKMGLVYQNSTVTLSALVSTSSEQGIIINETTPTYPASLPIFPKNDGHAGVAKLEFLVEREEDLWDLHVTSPLCKRSWCLQESILSPRQLYYGKRRIYWRCPAGYRSADGAAYGRHLPEKYIPNIFAMFHSDLLQSSRKPIVVPLNTMLEEFYALVQESSGRELTFVSDRLPALSGIMRRIHEAIPGDYLGGLWSCDIVSGLLWYAGAARHLNVETYYAPSWSWASTDAIIIFWDMGCRPKDQTTSSLFTLNLVSQQFQYRDNSDPYGEVISGSIVVKGRTLPLRYTTQYLLVKARYHKYGEGQYDEWKVRKQEPHAESRRKSKHIHLFDQTKSPYLISFNAYRYGRDLVEEETLEFDSSSICDEEFVALAVRIFEDFHDGELVTYIRGLLLRRLGESAALGIDRFERIGMFNWGAFDPEKLVLWQPAEVELV